MGHADVSNSLGLLDQRVGSFLSGIVPLDLIDDIPQLKDVMAGIVVDRCFPYLGDHHVAWCVGESTPPKNEFGSY